MTREQQLIHNLRQELMLQRRSTGSFWKRRDAPCWPADRERFCGLQEEHMASWSPCRGRRKRARP